MMSGEPVLVTAVTGAAAAGVVWLVADALRQGRASEAAALLALAAEPPPAPVFTPSGPAAPGSGPLGRPRRWTCPACGKRSWQEPGPDTCCLCPVCGEQTGRCAAGHQVRRTNLLRPDPCTDPIGDVWEFTWSDGTRTRAGLCADHAVQVTACLERRPLLGEGDERGNWEHRAHGTLVVARPLARRGPS